MKHSAFIATALIFASSGVVKADVRLPRIFGDHMVLQRESTLPVWGWADPDEKVTVSVGSVSASTITGPDGKWKVLLGRLADPGTAVELTVIGKNTVILHDVLVGDVWVCSGQSNMEFGMTGGIWGDTSAREEIPKARDSQLRLFVVPKIAAPKPAPDISGKAEGLKGSWQICTPETLPKLYFSAVAYYFGRDLREATGRPLGLIETCWGGTKAEAWTDLDTLKSRADFKAYADAAEKFCGEFEQRQQNFPREMEQFNAKLAQWNEENKEALAASKTSEAQWNEEAKKAMANGNATLPPKPNPLSAPRPPVPPDQIQWAPTTLYNGMLAPIIPLAVKGAIWYQGESNADTPEQALTYRTLFPSMISAWRNLWGRGDLPFVFVQIANFNARSPIPGSWANLREAQLKALGVANTAMAVTIDIGEGEDIHPKDKWDVGRRVALAARHLAYGEAVAFSGPIYKAMDADGQRIRIRFEHAEGGLEIGVPPPHFHPGEPRVPATELHGFAIAGKDGVFVPAKAVIEGETVLVSDASVLQPVAVRYAWADNPSANLYNKAGLPASPFRTDDFPLQQPSR